MIAALLTSRWTKLLVWIACLLPGAYLLWRYQHHQLGINWIEKVQRETGDYTLRLLLISLCISPLRRLPGLSGLIRYRRLLGLFAFFYGCMHFLTYSWIDKGWDRAVIWEDLTFRRFYIVGLLAFVLLIPLALTSTRGWIQRLGGKNWQRLHRLVYVSAAAGILHYHWQGKSLMRGPLVYAACLAVLLLWRVVIRLRKPVPQPAARVA